MNHASTALHATLSQAVVIGEVGHRISASIGITLITASDTRSATEILHDADAAMYRAKAAGRGHSHIL